MVGKARGKPEGVHAGWEPGRFFLGGFVMLSDTDALYLLYTSVNPIIITLGVTVPHSDIYYRPSVTDVSEFIINVLY